MANFQLPFKAENKAYFIHNVRMIDPASATDLPSASLLIENGLISDFGTHLRKEDYASFEQIDGDGNLLIPGILDIQVHFRDPGQFEKEDAVTGSMSAVAGGVTTVVCQPNTSPTLDNTEVFDYLKNREKEAYCNLRAYASMTKGLAGKELVDFKALANSGAVGFTDDGLPLMNSQLMRECMEQAKNLGLVVAQHCEDLNITNKGCINEGEVSKKLQVKGIPNISESIIVERDIAITGLTGGHYHVLHVSAKESMEAVIRAKKKGLHVTCEVCPHHFTLTDEAVLTWGTLAKMNPPLRSEEDRAFLVQALKEGWIDAITTDHAPHDEASKSKPLEQASFGIVGLEALLPLTLKLYHDGQMDLIPLLQKLTSGPADIIKMDRGRIAKGKVADLTLVDLNKEWIIRNEAFHSRSKNSPYDGMPVKGKTLMTFVSGALAYKD